MATRDVVPGLTYEVVPEGDVAVFAVTGAVGLSDIGDAMHFGMNMLGTKPKHVIVDFAEAARFRDIGVGLLSYSRGYLRDRGRRLVVVYPKDESILEGLPVDLREAFGVYDTREEAMKAILSDEPGAS